MQRPAAAGTGTRQAVEIVADNIQFLGAPDPDRDAAPPADEPASVPVPAAVGARDDDEDIPF